SAFALTDLYDDSTLPNGERVTSVSLTIQTGVASSTTADVDAYADEIRITGQSGSGGFSAANYNLTYVDGDFVVNRRPITVTASQQEKTYGDALSLSTSAFTILDKDGDGALPNGETIQTASLNSRNGIAA